MRSINGARAISVLAVCLLAGCAVAPTPGPSEQLEPEVVVKTKIVDNSCKWFKPIYPSASDVLADRTAEQITGHNETGATRCGWKPPIK